ncbi:hypothetical protein Bbelb_268170 [Branchiostoma belcheri]|nr:hypothetical protein Bbelb_268170 [Branchiostoma belcheri]
MSVAMPEVSDNTESVVTLEDGTQATEAPRRQELMRTNSPGSIILQLYSFDPHMLDTPKAHVETFKGSLQYQAWGPAMLAILVQGSGSWEVDYSYQDWSLGFQMLPNA